MKALRALAVLLFALSSSSLVWCSPFHLNIATLEMALAQGSASGSGQASPRPNTRPPQWLYLVPVNGSGITGLVAMNASNQPGSTDVTVGLNQTRPNMNYFTGIYFGTCAKPGGSAYALNRLKDGRSDTTLSGADYQLFRDENGAALHGPYAILVSQTQDKKTALACVDLKGSSSASGSAGGASEDGPEAKETNTINVMSTDGAKLVAKALLSSGGSKAHVKVILSQPNAADNYVVIIYEGACEDLSGVAFHLNKFEQGISNTDLSAHLVFLEPAARAIIFRYAIMLRLGFDQGAVLGCANFPAWASQ
jgi:hypothetical protein